MFAARFLLCTALVFAWLPHATAVTTARDVRAAFDELATIETDFATISSQPDGFLEKLVHLRHRMRDYALGSVIDAASRANRVEAIPSLARERLKEARFPFAAKAKWMQPERNALATVEILEVKGFPQWVGAKVRVELPCGADQSVYYLQITTREGDGPPFDASFRLASERATDDALSSSIDYSVAASSAGEAGDVLRVATIAASGGCSSYWHPVELQVLEVGDHPYRPRKLFERERLAYLGASARPSVRAVSGGFQFEYQAQFFLDLDRHSRAVRTTLAIDGESVRMEPPDLTDPAEFLDEWVATPWAESSHWTAGSRGEGLRSWHQALSAGTRNRTVTELVGVGECRDPALVWVRIDRGDNPAATRSIFGLLRKAGAGLRVDRFTESLPASCRTAADSPPAVVN